MVVLVLNGREADKVAAAKVWLELLPTLPHLRHAGLVLLGREDCNMDWLRVYLDAPAYRLRFVFETYGGNLLDNKRVFQWPLGVATYRGFPSLVEPLHRTVQRREEHKLVLPPSADVQPRRHVCNFFGTVYPNSSREVACFAL
jgi:hypothetical protein